MKKHLLPYSIVLIFIQVSHDSFAQEFTPTRHAIIADSTGRAGNVDEALVEWKLDYSTSLLPEVAYTIAALYSMKEASDSAFWWLKLALQQDSTISVLVNGDFYFLSEQPEWAVLESNQIAKSEAQQGKYPNLALSKRLWHLQMKDQAYTTQRNMAGRKLGQEHPATKALTAFSVKLRQENSEEVVLILDQYGWPKISEVGESAATSVFYIVQHGKAEHRKKYLPLLKMACEKKEAPWLWYANMYDRLLGDDGRKQCYGTQFQHGPVLERKPIEAPEFVNKRRKELGLDPIKDLGVLQKD